MYDNITGVSKTLVDSISKHYKGVTYRIIYDIVYAIVYAITLFY